MFKSNLVPRGTPVLGSRELVLPTWKLGLPTPIQGLSPNSAALSLLAGFAEGNIQVQGDAVQHLQEGNLAKLPQVTIELIEQGTGKIMGSIPDVNLVKGIEIPEGKSIGEMVRELEVVEQINETILDNGNFSMVREKQRSQARCPPQPLKQNQRRKRRVKIGQNLQSLDWGQLQEQPPNQLTGPSSKKGAQLWSPDQAPLLTNPRIKPLTGMPYTIEAEQRAIREIMEARKRPLEEEDEEEEEMTNKKRKSPPRRTSKDLVAKKKTSGEPILAGERRFHLKQTQVGSMPESLGCRLHEIFNVDLDIITQILREEPLTVMVEECSGRGRNRP